MGSTIDKQAMKALREQRKATIDRARKAIKKQNKMLKAIKEQLAGGPKTIPEVAAALRRDPAEVLLFVSALRKYGEVLEGAKDGDYFRYELAR